MATIFKPGVIASVAAAPRRVQAEGIELDADHRTEALSRDPFSQDRYSQYLLRRRPTVFR